MSRILGTWTILASILLFSGCITYFFRKKPPEVILFTTLGNRPFSDSVSTVWPDGSRVDRLLRPAGRRSYLSASGNSLTNALVVTVYEGVASGKKENHLFLYEAALGNWRRLVTREGAEGYGVLSPDNAHVVFDFTPSAPEGEKRQRGRLWVVDLPSGEAKSLTVNDEDGTWDTLPSWRPDSQEISFVRCRLTTSGVITKLMHVSVKGGEASLSTDGVSDACYSPDGKRLAIMTPDGLHIWDSSTGQRTLIVPWGKLPNRKYLAVGLAWSASLDKIAFTALNQSSNQSELWIVSSSGGEPKRIYSAADGRISFPAFVKTNNN